MSQEIIDFCEGLKSTLLGVEDQLLKARESLNAETTKVSAEAQKHLDDAEAQLKAFRMKAAFMAAAVQAELPTRTEEAREKFKHFGQEAQVALRHAAVFLAESASKGAVVTAAALQGGAKQASAIADKLRRGTAVATPDEETPSGGAE